MVPRFTSEITRRGQRVPRFGRKIIRRGQRVPRFGGEVTRQGQRVPRFGMKSPGGVQEVGSKGAGKGAGTDPGRDGTGRDGTERKKQNLHQGVRKNRKLPFGKLITKNCTFQLQV